MPITATTPISVPAKTYDQWWMHQLTISAPSPSTGKDASATVLMAPYSSATQEMDMNSAHWKQINIPGLLALAGTNADVGAAMTALLAAIDNVGKAQGKL